MIPWQQHLKQAITSADELLEAVGIEPACAPERDRAPGFPMRVPRPFVSRMQPGNLQDPLLRQVLSDQAEWQVAPGFVEDPLKEHESVLPGVLHKYGSRVLLVFRGGCAVNCRYCFRRHYPYDEGTLKTRDLGAVVDYLSRETGVNEVILSGGDPLMADDDSLATAFSALASVPTIRRLRIHSRLPVVIPDRVTEDLCRMMADTPLPVVMVMHINHAQEIDAAVTDSVAALRRVCRSMLNQAVILKGINDTVDAQVDLSETLFASGIDPYYLNVLDPVAGASHFYLSDDSVQTLYQGMLNRLPGYLVPKLVREVPGAGHKVPLIQTSAVSC